ncbi:MAG: putative zinc-finger [Deltaproteobacteria bacterium]|nr:putative zinc-finger [Deltaproteobacteria bacterium]
MIRCWFAQRNLTAWLDGELPEPRTRRLRHHLDACSRCSREAEHLRSAVHWHRRALPHLLTGGALETISFQNTMHSVLLAERRATVAPWTRPIRPMVLAGAALMAGLILVLLSVAGGPSAVLIPLGVTSPPVAVTREPDLFENYQLIQQLDALENFDTVQSEPLDDDETSHHG